MNVKILSFLGCAAALAFLTGCATTATDDCCEPESATAFVPLFPKDGAPAGWRTGAWNDVSKPGPTGTVWLVKGGVLQPEGPRGSWLMSEKEYGDFVLEYEFKLGETGNSGLALRAPMKGDPAFDGMELQMADFRYNPQAKDSELTGGLYRALAPTKQNYKPTEWNRYHVELRGSRILVLLNGEKIQDADLSTQTNTVTRHDNTLAVPLKERPRRGHIGFQELSRGEIPHVMIRNARIQELNPAAPLKPFPASVYEKEKMKRWGGILRALIMSIAVTVPLAGFVHAAPPHVLLILVDDLGWMDLHCQGNDRLDTPRIDALARQGVRFTDAYAASPVCSPTRGALITGLAPARLRITQHGKDGPSFWPKERPVQPPAAEHVLPLKTVTLAERLKEAGYTTGFFGKWHLSGEPDSRDPAAGGPEFWPEHQGFDINIGGCGLGGPPSYFDPYRIPAIQPRKKGEYLTDRLADETIAFLQKNHHQPTFTCLWTYNVHYPFQAPDELIAKYKGKGGPGIRNEIYAAQIEATDRAIGRVLDAIDRLGLQKNTLVMFTSDNGGWEGAADNRPLRSGKGDLYEGGLRVPLIIRWPGVVEKPATTNATPVISMDLTATILDAANVKLQPGETLDGATLRPMLQGNSEDRPPLFFHYPHYAFHGSNRPGGAIRSGIYKLIRRYDDHSVELFDLSKDLGETRNLAQQKPEVAARLNEQLGRWLKETGAQLPTPIQLSNGTPDGK